MVCLFYFTVFLVFFFNLVGFYLLILFVFLDVFLPSPEDLLVNLAERRTAIVELLAALPERHGSPSPAATQSALGAALQAAQKLMVMIFIDKHLHMYIHLNWISLCLEFANGYERNH